MNRQVSVLIRAALDSSFRNSFQSADQRLQTLNRSLQDMRRTTRDFSGLQRVRSNIDALTMTLAKSKEELSKVEQKLKDQRAEYAKHESNILTAKSAVERLTAAHAANRQELDRERAAIEASRKPTQEQIAQIQRMRAELKDLENAKKSAARMAIGAQATFDGKQQFLATLRSGVATKETQLASLVFAGAPVAEIARVTRELDQQRAKAEELANALHIYEDSARDAAAAAQVAAARFDQMNNAMIEQKAEMAAANELQNKRLVELEARTLDSAKAMDTAKAAEKSATEAKREYHKQAAQNNSTIEQLEKTEEKHRSAIAGTEAQIESATRAADKYNTSLEKQGHDVANVTEAERKHTQILAAQQALLAQRKQLNMLQDRSQELRSQAMSNLYFTIGSGFIFTAPLREAIQFEKAMVRVKAMAGANAEEFKRLKHQARDLGASTIYTAREVAEAQNELATAGYKTNDIIAVMPSLLALAESSMTSLARTAEITSEVLQGFRIDVSEMARVGDTLTAAYTGSASSLESLGEMLKYVAASSVDVGSSLEQTLAASSVLHNNGIKGSMAGTTMRSIFLRLAKPPKELQRYLDEMHISTKDTAGNMRNWMDIIADMNVALRGVGTAKKAAVSKALGGEEHAPGASMLLNAQKDGSLKFMQRTFELSPAFGGMAKTLLKMPDAELRAAAENLGIKFNRAMSGGGIAAAIAGSLKGLKGSEVEARMQKIFSELKLKPKMEDIKAEEFTGTGKAADAALKQLNISRTKPLGGTKTNQELTSEIKTQIQMLPIGEQLKFVEIFFSRTRRGVADLFMEFARSGKNVDQLLKALDEVMTMEKTRTELSKSAAKDLEEIESGFRDIMITFGEAFLPVLKDMMAWLKPILKGVGDWLKANQGVAKAIMIGVASLFTFSAAMAMTKFALSGVVDVFRAGKWLLGPKGAPDGTGKGLMRRALGGIWDGFEWGKIWGRVRTGQWKDGFGAMRSRGLARAMKVPGAKWIGKLLTAGRAVPVLGRVAGALRIVGLAMMGLPIGWIGAAIAGIALGGYLIYRNWSAIGPKLTALWEGIKNVFKNIWKDFWTGVGVDPLPILKSVMRNVLEFLKKMKPVVNVLFPGLGSVWEAIDDKSSWFHEAIDSGKKHIGDLFRMPPEVKVDAPPPAIERAVSASSVPLTQRNVITVNATINVDAGPAAPAQVASKIKGEIQSAFRSAPSFSFLDPVVVS